MGFATFSESINSYSIFVSLSNLSIHLLFPLQKVLRTRNHPELPLFEFHKAKAD